MDTGADVTALPIHILPALGIKKDSCHTGNTLGVGGIKIKTYEFMLPIKFGQRELSITASAVDAGKNSMPLLLGRKDVFEDKFNLILDSRRKMVVLKENY